MAMALESFAADVAAVEADEANLGTVVQVMLPDGATTVAALRRGASNNFEMQLAGIDEKRGDEISIRKSLLTAFTADVVQGWAKTSQFTIDGKKWQVDSVTDPDAVLYWFKLVQSW